MLRTKKLVVVFSVLSVISFSRPAIADEAVKTHSESEKQKLINEVLEASRATRNAKFGYDTMLGQGTKSMDSAFAQRIDSDPKLTPEQKIEAKRQVAAQVDKRINRFKQLLAEKVNVAQIVNDAYAKLYDKYFSEQELKDMLGFYKSSTGQHLLDVFPQLTNEGLQIVNSETLPKIREISAQVDQEIKDGKI
jgi:uncharacterized protein